MFDGRYYACNRLRFPCTSGSGWADRSEDGGRAGRPQRWTMTGSDRRLLSLLLLCLGVLYGYGNFSLVSLACVLLSLAVAINSLSTEPWGPALPRWVGVALVLALASTGLLYYNRFGNTLSVIAVAPLVAAIPLYTFARSSSIRIVAFALAVTSAVTAIVAHLTWGFAQIDVFQFQQKASQALLHGQNPYSPVVTSPEAMPPSVPTFLQLHLPYGPVLAVLEAPFRLAGDIRLLHILVAVIVSVAVLTLARRAGTLERSACVVLAFPLTIGMILFSWVDIITMAGLAVWIVTFRTHPKVAVVALALALGAKPTTLIALVPIFFWSIRARRQVLVAGAIAAVIALPFAMITGFGQFFYDVLGVFVNEPTRFDALTINSFLHSINLSIPPFAVSAVILATVSFLVAKWAYFNYYYIPAVLLMLAIAGGTLPVDAPEMIRPPAVFLKIAAALQGAARRIPRRPDIPAHDLPDPAA